MLIMVQIISKQKAYGPWANGFKSSVEKAGTNKKKPQWVSIKFSPMHRGTQCTEKEFPQRSHGK